MRATPRFALVVCTMTLAFAALSSAAESQIVAEQNNAPPITIALPEFVAGNPADAEIARNITRTIAANLGRSESLALVNSQANATALALVEGRIDRQGDGQLQIVVRLSELLDCRQLTGQLYLAEPGNWRRVAHAISDHIYERLTGKPGRFEADDQN